MFRHRWEIMVGGREGSNEEEWDGTKKSRVSPAVPHLGTTSVSKWFRDQSRFGVVGGSYHSSTARWPCSSWVLPTFLPVPRDQNSTFSNILWPASLMLRSKGNFCPSCKRETKRQLNAISAFSGLPEGIKGTPLKGFLRETHLYQGLVSAPQLQRRSDSCRTCARWSNSREQTTQPTDSRLGRPQGLWSWKKNQSDFTGILAKITLNTSTVNHKIFNQDFRNPQV